MSTSPTLPAPAFLRPDGVEKVTGVGRYTADLDLTGQAHAAFRYADHPHARIVRLDASRARILPGVFAVITHDDVPDTLYGGMVSDRYLFAKDVVRWEGEVIAAVAARTAAIAREAAALIDIEYQVLEPITDYVAAMAPDAPLIHPDWQAYPGDESMGRAGNTLGYSTIVKGDAEAAMAGAEFVVRGRYVSDASQGAPIEPRALLAQWAGDRVTIWTSTQVPFAARAGVAHTLGLTQSQVRIVVPLLGGGLGSSATSTSRPTWRLWPAPPAVRSSSSSAVARSSWRRTIAAKAW